MNYAEVLEKYLYRIARGELRDLEPLIPLIPPSVLFMPVLTETNMGRQSQLRLPIMERSNKKYLPVFLRRSHVMATYEKLRVVPQEVRGETLLLSLPPDVGILFEPNSSLEVSFDVSDFGYQKPDTEAILEPDLSMDPELPAALEDLFSDEVPKAIPLVDIKKLEYVLKTELVKYREVVEAFFIPFVSSYSDAILGILREEIDDERRYDLSEAIARISNEFYGYAGAIEIFDDLQDPNSSAWGKFQTEAPFYNRENITDQIEISKTDSSRKEGIFSSFGSLKRTGLKLFSN